MNQQSVKTTHELLKSWIEKKIMLANSPIEIKQVKLLPIMYPHTMTCPMEMYKLKLMRLWTEREKKNYQWLI